MADELALPSAPDSPAGSGVTSHRPVVPRDRAKGPGGDPEMVRLVSSLHSLAEHLGTAGESDDASSGYAPAPLRSRRFTRSGTVNGDDSLTGRLEGAKPGLREPGEVPEHRAGDPDAATPPAGGGGPGRPGNARVPMVSAALHRQRLKLLIVGSQIFGLTLLAAGLLLGWLLFSGSRDLPSGPVQEGPAGDRKRSLTSESGGDGVSDHTLHAIDDAMQAGHSGDLDAQQHFLGILPRQAPDLPGLEYQEGVLAVAQRDPTAADIHLTHSILKGENVAACFYIRATWAAFPGNYIDAARNFEAASRAEPFSARPFFYWAESLRRAGKPTDSLDQFNRALERPLTDDDASYIAFKRKLALIEAGEESFLAEVARHVKQPDSTAEWFLLAAAADLRQFSIVAAADHLRRAARTMPAADFQTRTADYVFQSQKEHPEIGSIVALPGAKPSPSATPEGAKTPTSPASAPAAASPADPAVWPLASADPANWPAPKVVLSR